jgi:hypothetical protein
MTSLNVAVGPIRNESCRTSGRVDDYSCPGNVSSVGTTVVDNHLFVQDHSSVGTGCGCNHPSVDVSSVLPSGGLDNVPGETTTE